MNPAENVIMYFLSLKTLTTTEIMKYLFLYDYYYRENTGRTGTELTFVRYKHGPFAQEVYESLRWLETQDMISSNPYVTPYGNEAIEYRAKQKIMWLQPMQQEIADLVVYQLSRLTFQAMLDNVYATPPMRSILKRENDGNRLFGEVILMAETKGIFRRSSTGREASLKRLHEKKRDRGTDQEYFDLIVKEFRIHEPLRRRATSVSQRFDS